MTFGSLGSSLGVEAYCPVAGALESPFAGTPKGDAWRVYELASGRSAEEEDHRFGGALSETPPVPTTAIFSRTDGICAW